MKRIGKSIRKYSQPAFQRWEGDTLMSLIGPSPFVELPNKTKFGVEGNFDAYGFGAAWVNQAYFGMLIP